MRNFPLGNGVPAIANHLTLEERDRIARLRYQGADQKEISAAARKTAQPPEKQGAGVGALIADQPAVIEERLRLGDFEGDTVLGPPGTGGLATLVDRRSRFTIVINVQSKTADHVHQKIKQRMKELDEQADIRSRMTHAVASRLCVSWFSFSSDLRPRLVQVTASRLWFRSTMRGETMK